MAHKSKFFGGLLGLILSTLAVFLILSITGGLARPALAAAQLKAPRTQLPQVLAEPHPQGEVRTCGGLQIPGQGCNKIQVIVMVDQSFSMPRNDPQRLRFYGAENLLDLLAHRYLEAVTANAPTPTIEIAVLHFGSDAPQQYNSGWITIAPSSEEAWAEEFEQLKTITSPEALKRRGLNATNFINPFRAARDLFAKASPQDEDCPRRVVLLLTDGAPAGAEVLRGAALKAHMDQVAAIARESMSGPGNFIYVTAFNVVGDNYWRETQPFWTQITGDSATADPPRSKQENTPQEVASRMEKIAAAHLGYQSFSVEPGALVFPPYLQSMRITYYAPNPEATFSLIDPDGNPVVPDGTDVILTGEGTPIQVLEMKNPQPGTYQLSTTATGGIITLLPTYHQFSLKLETLPDHLLQFTPSEIRLTLLDSSGNPLTPSDDPLFHLSVNSQIQQNGQAIPLALVEDGSSFKAEFLPVSAGPAQVELTAALNDAQGQEICQLLVGPGSEMNVSPIGVQIGESPGPACTPSQTPVTIPIRIVDGSTGSAVQAAIPVAWNVEAVSEAGSAVEAAITETGAGEYQLTLNPASAGDIHTTLAASVEVAGQAYPFFAGDITTRGLSQDRSLAFELSKSSSEADRWSRTFNYWFRRLSRDYSGPVLIGRRLFGWRGPEQVELTGRFYDTQTNQDEPGIERFFVELVPEGGGQPVALGNLWSPAGDGTYKLRAPAPGLGTYRVQVVDQGQPAACVSLGTLPTLGLFLVRDLWEYIFWLILILLVLLLLVWLFLALACRYINPPWGQLELVDPDGKVLWIGQFDSEDQEHAVRSCYTWKLDPPVYGIVKIRARSWDQPKHWVRVGIYWADGKQIIKRSLEHWEDTGLPGDLRIAWRPEWSRGAEKPPQPGLSDAMGSPPQAY